MKQILQNRIFKTLVIALLVCAFATAGGVLLTACGHQHEWTYQLSDTQLHYHKRICKLCGEEAEEPCTLQVQEQKDATCDEANLIVHTCTVCGNSHEHRDNPALGHLWKEENEGWEPYYSDDNPDDDEVGTYMEQHIRHCLRDNTHTQIEPCQFDEHDPQYTKIVAPDCENAGYTELTCKVCGGKKRTNIQPATNHNFANGWQQVADQDGKHTHYRVCQNENCTLPQKTEVAFCDMRLISVVDETCDHESTETYQCPDCQRTEETHLKQHLQHILVYEMATNGEGQAKHIEKCDREGCSYRAEKPCTFGEGVLTAATCMQQGYTTHTCTLCQYSYQDTFTDELEHVWSPWRIEDGWHVRTCSASVHEDDKHQPDYFEDITEADCETAGHTTKTCQHGLGTDDACTIVENEQTEQAKGHIYGAVEHYTDNGVYKHRRLCTRCKKASIEDEPCVFDEVETPATCTEAGYKTLTCRVCSFQYKEDYTQPPKGHDWDAWTVDAATGMHIRHCRNNAQHTQQHAAAMQESTTPAQCEEAGEKTSTCTHTEGEDACTIKTTEVLPPLGHSWDWQKATKLDEEDGHAGHKGAQCSVCGKTDEGAHVYTKNNLCDMCGWDGLVYTVKNGEAVLSNDNKVSMVEEIVVGDTTPDGIAVVRVATGALRANQNLRKITFGKNIKEIDYTALYECPNLEEVVFHEGVQIIRSEAFERCPKLAKFTVLDADGQVVQGAVVPSTITFISSTALRGTAFENNAANWTDAKISDGHDGTIVVGKALYVGKVLLSVKLDTNQDTFEVLEGTIAIGENVFRDMKNLKNITLPKTLKTIGMNAFYGCLNIENVYFGGNIAQWLGISYGNEFSSPLHYTQHLHIEQVPENLVIDEGVSTIPAGCFRGDNLKSVEIAASVTYIGAGAFEDCENLESVTIKAGSKLTYLGENAFKNTKFFNTEANWDEDGALYLEIGGTEIGSTRKYILVAVKADATGKDVQIGEGETMQTQNNTFKVKEGTVLVASGAFRNCSNLRHIELPASVKNIGDDTFVGCSSLATLTFAKGEANKGWMVWTEVIGRPYDVYANPSSNAYRATHDAVGEWYSL